MASARPGSSSESSSRLIGFWQDSFPIELKVTCLFKAQGVLFWLYNIKGKVGVVTTKDSRSKQAEESDSYRPMALAG